jgi:hypothetical protein
MSNETLRGIDLGLDPYLTRTAHTCIVMEYEYFLYEIQKFANCCLCMVALISLQVGERVT